MTQFFREDDGISARCAHYAQAADIIQTQPENARVVMHIALYLALREQAEVDAEMARRQNADIRAKNGRLHVEIERLKIQLREQDSSQPAQDRTTKALIW